MGGREQDVQDRQSQAAGVQDAQRRLLLVLRAEHGPQVGAVWVRACSRAGVVSTGQLSADELDRVAAELSEGKGAQAVAGRTCRVRLMFLRTGGSAASPPAAPRPAGRTVQHPVQRPVQHPVQPVQRPVQPVRRPDGDRAPLSDSSVRAALHLPGALEEADWVRRLADLERELA